MEPVAQTNLQLYRQVLPGDVGAVVTAYNLAAHLFTGQFRASGKTFLAHLIGTASILAGLRRPRPEITAALLHAAYQAGDFGLSTTDRRDEVRRAIGEVAESYVHAYSSLRWEPERHRAELPQESEDTIAVLRMRVANELEDCLDGALAWVGPTRRQATLRRLEATACLASDLGLPEVAEALRQAHTSALKPDLAGPERSYKIPPRTYQQVAEIVARRLKPT